MLHDAPPQSSSEQHAFLHRPSHGAQRSEGAQAPSWSHGAPTSLIDRGTLQLSSM